MELKEVIEKAGGQSHVARAFGVSRQAVFVWISTGKVPRRKVLALAQMAGVRPSDIDPETYPRGLVA